MSGQSSAIETIARHREPPLCLSSFLRFLPSPLQPQRTTAVACCSSELARSHRCVSPRTIPPKAPLAPHGPRRRLRCAIRALGERHCRFCAPPRHGRAGDLTVASTAPFPSSFPSSRLVFYITCRCSGDGATANAGLAEPEHSRAPPCAMAEPPSSVAGVPRVR